MDERLLITYGFPAIGGLLAFLSMFLVLRAGRRHRLVSDLPTSKTTGVFIGLVELKGTAEAEGPLVSFLAEQSCVYYQWHVDEHWSRMVTETSTDSQGRVQTRTRNESGWTTVARGGDMIPFYLRDDCGIIRIRPEKAEIHPLTTFDHSCGPGEGLYYEKGPAAAVANSVYRRRFVEVGIPLHAPLFVVGQASERDDLVAPEIAHDSGAETFLISTRSEERVRRGLAWQFWLIGLLGAVFAAGGFIVRDANQHRPIGDNVPLYLVAGSVFASAWLLAWIGMAYNSIVALRRRVHQAMANVDVQLKRRHDLIPNLVTIVRGMRDYEKTLQSELAQLRNQLIATPPGEPGPDPQAMTGILGAIQERYPQLRANGSFLALQHNLVDTEQRIALARGYFNEIATFYNTRLQTVPDRFIAALGAMKPQNLMTADDFERAPVEVKLAD
ncbi:MAG: LemA family protein [Isosphaeraceae bacterium]